MSIIQKLFGDENQKVNDDDIIDLGETQEKDKSWVQKIKARTCGRFF